MKTKKLLAALLTLLIFLSPTFAAAETVVTSFYPIYLFALNLTQGIDGITIRNLAAPNTGCLHDYQLSTGDMKVLNKADVFLINGAGMESYLTRVMDTFPKLPVVDASAGITLLTEDGMDEYVDDHDHDHEDGVCPCCGGHHDDDDDDDHDHEHHHHHDHDDHDEDEHEHHHHDHEDGETCSCGHHHHHHHGHDADEVFVSVGVETANRYEQDEVKAMLDKLSDEEEYGTVLRAKGVLQNAAGEWFQFDYVPGESQFRPGTPDYTGRLCVIGAHIDEKALRELFKA